MTSRSRKKHRITVQTFIRTIRIDALTSALAITATAVSAVPLATSSYAQQFALPSAQPSAGASAAAPRSGSPQLMPVQPIRSAPQPLARNQNPAAGAGSGDSSWNLRWQASGQVASATPQPAPAVARAGHTQGTAPEASESTVRLTAGGDFAVYDGDLPPRSGTARSGAHREADPFLDPFNDGGLAPPATQPEPVLLPPGDGRFVGELQAPQPQPTPEDPASGDDSIGLPPSVNELETDSDASPRPNPFSPGPPADDAANDDADDETASPVPSPSDRQPVAPVPGGSPLRDRSERAIDSASPSALERLGRRVEPSCDELRERIAARTIRKVTLDISPPFRPDVLEQDEYEQLREEFVEDQPIREWRSLDGELLGRGRLIDLAYESAVIANEEGLELALPMADLSEPDLAYVTGAWGLPRECQLPQVPFEERQWLPIKMTWKASELCHKPLYFEEVNLERYGHTAGPFAQPVVSTAHFFFNIAVLPYKMGIHPPNECQYALGYYRPGNCAPWIIPPVPLSLRGAIAETAFVGGMVALIP